MPKPPGDGNLHNFDNSTVIPGTMTSVDSF